MKKLCAKIVGVVVLAVSLVSMGYGNETKATVSGNEGSPTALLLVEQGEQLMKGGGQMEGALASFDLAIEVDPEFSKAYLHASAVASQLGDNKKAIAYLEALRRQKPMDMETGRLLASLKALESRNTSPTFPSSGFIEFGAAALLGGLFLIFVAGHEFGMTLPGGAAAIRVEKPYFIYPLLKIAWQGAKRELLTVHEKRHRSLHWKPRLRPAR